jgi:hypothetical protein
MGAGLELVDLECQAVEKRSIARPRFKNRTWGTLRVRSQCEREKLTYPSHPAPSASLRLMSYTLVSRRASVSPSVSTTA